MTTKVEQKEVLEHLGLVKAEQVPPSGPKGESGSSACRESSGCRTGLAERNWTFARRTREIKLQ